MVVFKTAAIKRFKDESLNFNQDITDKQHLRRDSLSHFSQKIRLHFTENVSEAKILNDMLSLIFSKKLESLSFTGLFSLQIAKA